MKFIRALLAVGFGLLPTVSPALSLEQTPLFIASTEPRVMLLLSRDHELYKKAYTDYSDLDGDGALDTTYNDTIEYYGYFNPKRCYDYLGGRYEPAAPATGANSHHCSSAWSGNFMNWATMTRMDVARKVLYGGLRSTDNDGATLGDTVLERAMITSDVHAFAKVFEPAGGATEVQKYVPVNNAAVTLCSVSRPPMGTLSKSVTTPPLVRVTTGSWAQWAASEVVQCATNNDSSSDNNYSTRPASATDYNVRVAVCVPNKLESNCKAYSSGAVKPTGLLQRYGDVDVPRRVRFGLMTGSYDHNKQGGVLRRNTNLIAGNATASLNEIYSTSGRFTNNAGIIDTLNRLRISDFKFGDSGSNANKYISSPCNTYGTTSFADGECQDWGNPLTEMYLESLRYFAGESTATANFATNDSGYLASTLPSATWSDPLPSTEWCALSNIVVLSTGLNSFDGDNLTGAPAGININTLTDMVGTAEGLAGAAVFAGSNGATSNNQCTAKTIGNLSDVSGICPEVPAQEGTYKIAGLANANRQVDLRPLYQTQRGTRWGGANPINSDWAARQPLATYTVALAESLPSFSVTTSGGTIKFLPACQAHATWTPCTLTDVRVQSATATGGTFLAVWEDSQWGNDYDMDAISRVTWCVGISCSPALASNKVKFTVSLPQKNAGAPLRFGVIVNGSTADGISSFVNAGANYNCTDSNCTASTATPVTPLVLTYTAGTSSAITLKNPLWYAAKYGAQASVWDIKNNNNPLLGPDGEPDNFFEVRNPANLEQSLAEVFDSASQPDAAASSVATNTANLQVNNYIFQAKFQPTSWSGQLLSLRLDTSGGVVTMTQKWDAAPKLDAQLPGNRVILTKGATDGVSFEWANLTNGFAASQQTLLNTNYLGVNDGLGSIRLDYIRGVDTNEGAGPGQFRERNKTTVDGSVLGDIVNSGPLYVGAPSAGYADIDHPGYSGFRTRYLLRKSVVYVGANDGMFHGFDAALDTNGDPVSTGGDEIIAYVPTQVFGSLSRLTAQNYNRNHRYLVDGTPMAADAYLNLASLGSSDEDKWRTVLIGNMNSGGKGYFALDITNPNLGSEPAPTFSTANAASLLLWEFTDADDPDMGYAYNLPPQHSGNSQAKQIVKLQNNKWAAIVGNGYNSTAGQAVLYLLYIENGVDGSWATTGDFVKVVANVGPSNGLSTPVPYDSDGDGKVDVAYAGDLLGNMWRFNLSNPATPTVSRLFGSGSTKPITTPPEVLSHPSGGNMVLFGTGKYLELADNANNDQQAVYGVRDDGSGATVTQSDLQLQTMTGATRTISSNQVSSTQKGWFIELPPLSKERMTGIPKLTSGLFFFNTLIPSASACDSGGTGWLMAVDSLTGAQPSFPVFDGNNDGVFDSSDYNIGGMQIGAALGGTTFIRGGLSGPLPPPPPPGPPGPPPPPPPVSCGSGSGPVGVGIASLTTGAVGTPLINFGSLSCGRVNWREILR